VAVSNESFLVLESTLASNVGEAVLSEVKPIITAVGVLVSKGEFASAGLLVNKIDVSQAVEGVSKEITLASVQSVLFGARDYNNVGSTRTFDDGIQEIVHKAASTAVTLFTRMLGNSLREHLHRVVDIAETKDKEGAISKAGGKVSEFVGFASAKLNSSALAASSLHTSRLATFGLLTEATLTGHTVYEISEVLDIKICPICKEMDGKSFEVTTALDHVVTLLDISDPEDLKSLAPFPRQDKKSVETFKKMSDLDLIKNGWNKPPFHILCRGLLRKSSQSVSVVEAPTINTNDLIKLIEDGRLDTPDHLAEVASISVSSDGEASTL
jgi:hypothetical protein